MTVSVSIRFTQEQLVHLITAHLEAEGHAVLDVRFESQVDITCEADVILKKHLATGGIVPAQSVLVGEAHSAQGLVQALGGFPNVMSAISDPNAPATNASLIIDKHESHVDGGDSVEGLVPRSFSGDIHIYGASIPADTWLDLNKRDPNKLD